MQLLIVRHAVAENREAFAQTGQDDAQRPLLPKGQKRMRQITRAFKRLVPHVEVIATSPHLRAQQTAGIVVSAYPDARFEIVDALAPGGERRAVLSWLQMQPEDATIALVGHEPDLGGLTSWLLASGDHPFVEFKKGGACLLDFPTHVTAGDAVLSWLLAPGQLRRLGKARGVKKGVSQR